MFQMIGAVAQFERSLIGELAKAKGKVLGRPPLRKLSRTECRELRQERVHRNVPFRILAKNVGASVWSAHRGCAGKP